VAKSSQLPPHPRSCHRADRPEAVKLRASGHAALADEAFSEAAELFSQALELAPGNAGLWHDLGGARCRLEQWDRAREAFDHALELAPGDGELLFHKGVCQVRAGLTQDAAATLEAAVEATEHLEARFQLGLLYARESHRRHRPRQQAVQHLEAILTAVDAGRPYAAVDRVCFALGGLYGNAPESLPQAISVYRRGLAHNPLSAVGHNSLGQLLMESGQLLGALGEFKVAIQLDPAFRVPYTQLAHLLFHHIQPSELAQEYAHIIEEFAERAPRVLAHLSLELTEQATQQIHEGIYTKGHQLKNLLGILGSRLRGMARRRAGDDPSSAADLELLVSMQGRVYDEWVGFLGAMKPDPVRPVLLEPARLVRHVAEVVRTQQQNAALEVRVEDGVPRLEADEHMLREAITNLCLNALEACEAVPGARITLGVGFDPERSGVFIEVEDNGPGIAPAQLKHVFDPGFTTKAQGNGYGLSIARRVAQAHHGELRVKSRLGHGTVFRLDLPVNFEGEEPGAGMASSFFGTQAEDQGD
jgi:signal transduction histidine kinase